VYGKRILGAEAFTATDGEKWLLHPGAIKALGDWAFCEGINRFVFHRYALQPWLERTPGMSMGPWGLHYERTQTWWEQSVAWHEYLARCQFLLRQEISVADICFLEPEGSPMRFTPTLPGRSGNTPDRPRYNFDGCSPEVVLTRMKVKGGRLVLPDGMSYRLLVLPQVETMTPRLLRKVQQLVKAGVRVVGPPPASSPSLANYPACDAEVQKLAADLWLQRDSKRSQKAVQWNESFRTPEPNRDAKSPLADAKWVWGGEGNPAAAAPVGARQFRRLLELPANDKITSARMAVTADNSFDLRVNGTAAGSGEDFNQVYMLDLTGLLKPGTNVLAVEAVNGAEQPNPAGLIGSLSIQFASGRRIEVPTDARWETAVGMRGKWFADQEASEGWVAAKELGRLGMAPWNNTGKGSGPAYVFPNFAALAGLLQDMDVPPDFECLGWETSAPFRYVHRQIDAMEIYFVANSQTNWVGANCAFRVSGKQPELWNPLTGEVRKQAWYEEKDGRTFLPLWLEPAGSVFVVFRKFARALSPSELVVGLSRDGQSVRPLAGQILTASPAAELAALPRTGTGLLAWKPGHYDLKFASGQARSLEVPALPAAMELRGPWEVRFQAGRGAPEKIVMEGLSDWSQNSEPGVMHFSGTATYTTTLNVPPEMVRAGQRLYLDLGNVAVMAHPFLNGQDLGILWRNPYRVEITRAIKAGENVLRAEVVNLWINRMIGDEQLPEDSERNANGTLTRWPSWFEDGRPSPAGRYSFTTWRLWKKDSPLQPSGLLGPVTIVPASEIEIGPGAQH
jgi:hypothetical protein